MEKVKFVVIYEAKGLEDFEPFVLVTSLMLGFKR